MTKKQIAPIVAQTVDDDGQIVIWKTPYNHNTDREAGRVALFCGEPSLAQQSFKDEADINVIVERVLRTNAPPIPLPMQYGDLTTVDDYHTMQTKLAETNGLFYRLPPDIREEYSNNPGAWLQDVNEKLAAGDIEPLRAMGLDLASVDAQLKDLEVKAAKAHLADLEAQAAAKQGTGKETGAPAPAAPKAGSQPA